MTDPGLIAKKLAFVATCLRELRTLARPDAMDSDVRERRFVEHTLQLAIQACQDVASHVVSDQQLGEPRSNQELFKLLQEAGFIDDELALALRHAIGLRNILVHGYASLDSAIVRDVLEHHLMRPGRVHRGNARALNARSQRTVMMDDPDPVTRDTSSAKRYAMLDS